jgi:glucose/arabinose dehydrogenase
MSPSFNRAAAAALLLFSGVNAQETTVATRVTAPSTQACATVLTPSYSPPVVAQGWKAQLVATGLSNPRSIKLDSNGALLVLESRKGLTHWTFTDNGGTCLSVKSNATLIEDTEVSLPSQSLRRVTLTHVFT